MAHDFDCGSTEHVVLFIRQSLRRGNNNGIASVYAERVEVFHVTDSDAVVFCVANNFVFGFLPASKTFLDENLGCKGQTSGTEVLQLLGCQQGFQQEFRDYPKSYLFRVCCKATLYISLVVALPERNWFTNPKPTQSVGAPHDTWVSHFLCSFKGLFHRRDRCGLGNRDVDFLQRFREQITILTTTVISRCNLSLGIIVKHVPH